MVCDGKHLPYGLLSGGGESSLHKPARFGHIDQTLINGAGSYVPLLEGNPAGAQKSNDQWERAINLNNNNVVFEKKEEGKAL